MKKLILELLRSNFTLILESWKDKLHSTFKGKLSATQIQTFVEHTLNTFIDVVESSDYKRADQYLIDIHNLFTKTNLNLLEISQIFSQGRFLILNNLEGSLTVKYDPVVLLGFLDEIIEQVYARYAMLHQESQMKQLTSDRDRIADKLDISQQYLKNILHSSESAIMLIDEQEHFIAWNKGAEKLFGYKEEEVLGQPSSLLLPKDEKYFKELKHIQTEAKGSGSLKILETERMAKNGEAVTVRLNVSKLPSKKGEYVGRSVIIEDFTEVKKLQEQVDQSEKLAVIGQLAAGIAHEIGNPLASISSVVQILQRKVEDKFVNEQLADIKENIDRISKIVRELVDFSRPPSYDKKLVEISDVIKTALGIVKYDKRVKKVKFETNLVDVLPKVRIVPDQLLQVFVNILINALDAVEGTGTLVVNSRFDKKFIYVEICDNGCGMDKHTVERIFNPFYTTKGVGKGTGLGLTVSYGIIKKFNGMITVQSTVNEGSKFTIKLPIEK